jgi:hypothetical protein
LTINHLPDEVLLEIFDSHRQGIDPYDHQWRKRHVWIILAHVCRQWRAVVFASASRLDLGVTVGPEKPDHIKTILSGPLPIFIDYNCSRGKITGSALWRMHAALRHHDRVREIAFVGKSVNFDKFFKATNRPFPILESLAFEFRYCYFKAKIPDTFFRGRDTSIPHLRRLKLYYIPFTSISGFLLSATALTNLDLAIDPAGFSSSTETSLLACLQGMPFLGHLELGILSSRLDYPSQPTPRVIVPLSKLTYFYYHGSSIFLDALVAGLSAPSLRDVSIHYYLLTGWPHFVQLSRFISEIEEHYHAVHVALEGYDIHLSLLTQSEYIGHCKPRFELRSGKDNSPKFMMKMSGELSAMLTTVEDLRVTLDNWVDGIPWRRFLQQFPNLKALRIEGGKVVKVNCIACSLLQDHEEPGDDLAFLPSLEEIEIGNPSPIDGIQRGPELAAFEPFVSARQQAGRPVKFLLDQ